MEITEIVEIIIKINNEIGEFLFDNSVEECSIYLPFIKLETDGENISLEFLGMYLWDSDNDPRDYIDTNDEPLDFEHEPLDIFLRREIIKIINIIKIIKLDLLRDKNEDNSG